MLGVPLLRKRRKAAKRPVPRADPSSRQADSPRRAPIDSPPADSSTFTQPEIPTTLIPEKPRRSSRTRLLGMQGLAAMIVCMSQVAVQEAPAWGLSMVVHMVTLVTMAMVAVPDNVPCKAKHIIVAPPEEQQVEEVQDFCDRQPATLDETAEAEVVTLDSLDSNVRARGRGHYRRRRLARPRRPSTRPLGQDSLPQIDLLTAVHAYANAYSDRGMSGNVQDLKREGGTRPVNDASSMREWLANHQMPDGGWSFDLSLCPSCHGQCRDSGKMAEARNAATGLALLPFLGSGQTHKDSHRYKSTIRNGLKFLSTA